MKKYLLGLLVFLLVACANQEEPSFTPPQLDIQEVTIDGITAWLIEDHRLPMISVSFVFKGAGAVRDDKAGAASFMSAMLTQGAGDMEYLAFQEALDARAIELSFHARRDDISGELKTLSRHAEEAFRLASLALRAPLFDPKDIARLKEQWLASLAREQEDPSSIAFKAWFEHAFKNHPYAHPADGTTESIKSLSRQDLIAQRAFLGRDNLIIGVSGDITPDELKKALSLMFGALPATTPALAEFVPPPLPQESIAFFHEGVQTEIVFGMKGMARNDPHYFALRLINHVLGGGGLTSRLIKELREKRGLVYGAHSWLNELNHAPLLMGNLATKNESAQEAVEILQEELAKMAQDGMHADELKDAKSYLKAALPLRLTSRMRFADFLVALQYHDLGKDYLQKRNKRIDQVSMDDIKNIAHVYLSDTLFMVSVGASDAQP